MVYLGNWESANGVHLLMNKIILAYLFIKCSTASFLSGCSWISADSGGGVFAFKFSMQ